MNVRTQPFHSGCANLQCPNRLGEGQFLMVDTGIDVGGHRTISLFLCFPCGKSMERAFSETGEAK